MRVAILTTDSREHDRDYGLSKPSFGAAPEALLEGLADLAEAEIHVVSCTQQPMQSPERLAGNIWFHSLHVPKFGWMRTLYQGCLRACRRKLREIQPDVVHGQGTERDCAISAAGSGFPNVVTIHGNMAELARLFQARTASYGWLAARLEDLTLRRTAGVFCNSAYTERLVQPRTRRTWRVPNAVRTEFFTRLAPETRPARPTLLNVGVVSPRKRQVELLDMARELRRQGLDFEIQFVGRAPPLDPYAAAFLAKIRPMEGEGYARYLGVKPAVELIQCLDRASALVHFPCEEAFGLVVAEALSRELKLFGARVGGIAEIAGGVSDAELFEAADWNGLATAIGRWLHNGAPRSAGAGRLMRTRYHPRTVAQRHLEIYGEVLRSGA